MSFTTVFARAAGFGDNELLRDVARSPLLKRTFDVVGALASAHAVCPGVPGDGDRDQDGVVGSGVFPPNADRQKWGFLSPCMSLA